MESNHGLAESIFTGHTQTQRGQIERWSFVMEIKRMTRHDASAAMGFFMQIEGRLGTFLMHDPAASAPLGRSTGNPVLAEDAAAGSRTVEVTGWTPNTPKILRAGDWVQIGDQLSRVRVDCHSDSAGVATLDIWPKLMISMHEGTAVKVRPAKGIFRFTSDLPAWDIVAADLNRSHSFRLTGSQVILLPPTL